MPHVVYTGQHDEVEIGATGQVVRRGQQVEVDADLAASLLEQSEAWAKPATKAAKNATPSSPAAADPDPGTLDGQPITEENV